MNVWSLCGSQVLCYFIFYPCYMSHVGKIYLAGFFWKLNCYWAFSFFDYFHLLSSLSTYKFESGW